MNYFNCFYLSYSSDDGVEVVDVETFQRNFHEDAIRTLDMTSLGTFMLFGKLLKFSKTIKIMS